MCALCAAVESGQDIGSAAMLEQLYEKPQKKVNSTMISALDAIKAIYAPQASRAREWSCGERSRGGTRMRHFNILPPVVVACRKALWLGCARWACPCSIRRQH